MTNVSIIRLRAWIKTHPDPLARRIFSLAKKLRAMDLPAPKCVFKPLYFFYIGSKNVIDGAMRVCVWTPLFKSQLWAVGKRLYLYGGLPYLTGPTQIRIGNDCRISGKTTISGRHGSTITPSLTLGHNIDVGWQTTIAVGRRIVLHNNVRIAGQCFLAGYPGHPLEAAPRARGEADHDTQVGDIVLQDDVWLGTGVSVMAGVTIGVGTVVAAGSIVTKNLPPGVLAAGNPARVIRHINQSGEHNG